MRVAMGCVSLSLILVGCQSSTPIVAAKSQEAIKQEAKEGGYQLLSTKELAERVSSRSNMVLIDTTPREHFQRHHILGATHYLFPADAKAETWDVNKYGGPDSDDFARRLGKEKGLPVVFYAEDSHSLRSHHAASWAKKLGFTQVYRYAEGLAGWTKSGNETRSVND